jgi:hypothetical protein
MSHTELNQHNYCANCREQYDPALIEITQLWVRKDGKDFCSVPCQIVYERLYKAVRDPTKDLK